MESGSSCSDLIDINDFFPKMLSLQKDLAAKILCV